MTMGELLVKLGLDPSGLTSGLSKAESGVKSSTGNIGKHFDEAGKHAGKFGSVMSGIGMGIGMAGFNIAMDGVRDLGNVLGESSKAYQEAQVSQAQMLVALQNNVAGFNGNTDSIEKLMEARMRLGFDDEEQRSSFALLVGATKDVAKAQTAQAAAMDLARLKGISLEEATTTITSAMGGRTAALKKLGIEVEKGATQEQILAAITKVAGGQAEAYADTSAGKLAAAHIKVREAMEKVGKITDQLTQAVMPALADIFDGVVSAAGPLLDQIGADLPPILDTARGAIQALVDGISPLVDAFASALPGAISPVVDIFKGITGDSDKLKAALAIIGAVVLAVVVPPFLLWAGSVIALTWPILAVGAAVAALILILDKTGMLKELGKDIVPALSAAFSWLSENVLPPIMDLFNYLATQVLPPLIDTLSSIYKAILPALTVAFNVIQAVIPPIVDGIAAGIKLAVGIIKADFEILKTAIGVVQAVFEGVQTAIGAVWDGITGSIKSAVNTIIGFVNTLIRAIDSIKFSVNFPSLDIPGIGTVGGGYWGWGGLNIKQIPTLHSGGIVPGRPGSDVLAMLRAGELVVPAHQANTGAAGNTINLNVYNAQPEPASTSIQRELLKLAALGYVSKPEMR